MERKAGTTNAKSKLMQPGSFSATKRRKLGETTTVSTASTASTNVTVSQSSLSKKRPLSTTVPSTSQASSSRSKSLFSVGTRSSTNAKAAAAKKPATSSAPKGATAPKRAAWDTKGKLEDLTKQFESFRKEMLNKENMAQQVVEQKDQAIVKIECEMSEQLQSAKKECEKLKNELQQKNTEFEVERESFVKKLKELKDENAALQDKLELVNQQLRTEQKMSAKLRLDEKDLKLDLEARDNTIQQNLSKIAGLDTRVKECEGVIEELKRDKLEHEYERRKLHNTIQELKGNIRVFCRVRPCLPSDGEQENIYSYPDIDQKKISLTKPLSFNETAINETLRKTEKFDFSFDKVFDQSSGQSDIFEEISQLVQSALDGYNVCIFAYGQTGSGKTYTMQGPDMPTDSSQGVIPRSIAQIFQSASQLEHMGWKYTIEASFLEIYNEKIFDLLGNPGKPEKHEIQTASGDVVVTNLTIVNVGHPAQVKGLMETAVKNRHVAETMLNAKSSRSHSVFTLKIKGSE
ncbi:KIFC1 [Bugula neritina]|uniref:KIFC1 n=1 Tax=Bugula neritina TaxID=10212 RepID=A0A7J7JXN9_BUGNE|nr:KIFC1 [Bugula neritina]